MVTSCRVRAVVSEAASLHSPLVSPLVVLQVPVDVDVGDQKRTEVKVTVDDGQSTVPAAA